MEETIYLFHRDSAVGGGYRVWLSGLSLEDSR
jgi:hypothetical protein